MASRPTLEGGQAMKPETVGMSSAEFLTRIKQDAERYKRVVQQAGVKAE